MTRRWLTCRVGVRPLLSYLSIGTTPLVVCALSAVVMTVLENHVARGRLLDEVTLVVVDRDDREGQELSQDRPSSAREDSRSRGAARASAFA